MGIVRDGVEDQVSKSEFEMSSKVIHFMDDNDTVHSPAHPNPKYIVFEILLLDLYCWDCGWDWATYHNYLPSCTQN